MKKLSSIKLIITVFTLCFSFAAFSQVSINDDGTKADSSAMLDVKSSTKGFLPPRMTTEERDDITDPADGLIIYNLTTKSLNYYAYGFWYELDGTPDIPTVYNPVTGRTWMDRNLGASRVAISSTDQEAYGDLYQWGRAREGHEKRISDTTLVLATYPSPIPYASNIWDGLFINATTFPFDWLTPQDNTLWQGVNGRNNPCPHGFRIPTYDEWYVEVDSWPTQDAEGAFNSPLKLVMGGGRYYSNGYMFFDVGSEGYYWSSTIDASDAYVLKFNSNFFLFRGTEPLVLA
jgi:uncharacterized protein (TIGR02145 family)